MSTALGSAWAEVRLGDIGHSLIGLTYSPEDVKPSGTLVLRASNIQDGRLAFDDNVFVDCAIPDKIRVQPNDVLICVRNGSRRLIGKSVLLDERVVGQTFGAFMAVFRSDANPFLRYFFQSDSFKRQIDEHLGATINQITNASLNSVIVWLPSSEEQQAIASLLADVDRHVAALEQVLAKKRAIKRGMMQQLLTGRTRLQGFSGEWSNEALGAVATVNMGQSPVGSSYNMSGRGVPLVQGNADILGRRTIERIWTTAATKRCKVGDVVLTVRAPVGYTAVATSDVCLGRGVCSLAARQDTRYLYHALVYAEPRWAAYEQGSTFTAVNSNEVKSFTVPWPADPDERKAIGHVLDDIDAEISVLQQRLVKVRAIKTGMAQELLSGRTRLPVEAGAA